MRQYTILVLCLFLVISCSRKPKSDKDQVSYTVGAQFGRSLRAQKLDLDMSVVKRGLADGYESDKNALDDGEMQAAMMKFSDTRQKEQGKIAEKAKSASDEFLTKNKTAEGVKTTASGLQYKIISEGSGKSPTLSDQVTVNYRGKLIDGTEFDSSYKRNLPAEFPLKGVIPGWSEGIQLMKKGGKAVFFVPPELGYGGSPRQNIPANAVLIFEVELLDFKPIK